MNLKLGHMLKQTMASKGVVVGGWTKVSKTITKAEMDIYHPVEGAIKRHLRIQGKLQVHEFKKQLVAGYNYIFKASIDDKYFFFWVYVTLKKQSVRLESVKRYVKSTGKYVQKSTPLEPWKWRTDDT